MTKEIIIISGPSGSGKFSALKVFEDIGFYVIDNLPPEIFLKLLELAKPGSGTQYEGKSFAATMDARNPNFTQGFEQYQKLARRLGFHFKVLFLEAQDKILIRRFSETRRRHPLSPFGYVREGIERERQLLHNFKRFADHVIDTSHLSVHELKEVILKNFYKPKRQQLLPINIVSFGYRHGIPLDADLVLDLRFLPNPFFEKRLSRLSGRQTPVKNFLTKRRETKKFLRLLKQLLDNTIPLYQKEGKTYLTLAFGCTGGRHRSVAVGEIVAKDLKKSGYPVIIRHRDVNKGQAL